jgi:hypothetical protein
MSEKKIEISNAEDRMLCLRKNESEIWVYSKCFMNTRGVSV